MYGNELANIHAYKHQRTNRQLLHAYEYLFTDIDGSTITIQAPLTRDFFGPQTTDDHTL
jgi:23S rRNA-/tRNA-specific pseudouridylate synthase